MPVPEAAVTHHLLLADTSVDGGAAPDPPSVCRSPNAARPTLVKGAEPCAAVPGHTDETHRHHDPLLHPASASNSPPPAIQLSSTVPHGDHAPQSRFGS